MLWQEFPANNLIAPEYEYFARWNVVIVVGERNYIRSFRAWNNSMFRWMLSTAIENERWVSEPVMSFQFELMIVDEDQDRFHSTKIPDNFYI